MPAHNAEIVEVFNRYATLLEIEGANPFGVRAHRKAARTIWDLPHSVASLLAEGADLSELPGIGKDLAGKIHEIVDTGRLHELEDLERESPSALVELTALPGLGPKRVKVLFETLKIDSLPSLRDAIEAGRLRSLRGFGRKSEEKILRAIERRKDVEKRTKLIAAEEVAESLLSHLKQVEGVQQAIVAGSSRRRKETVGDLDILVTCRKGTKVMERFVGHEDVDEVVSKGRTRSTVLLRSGLQVDLRVVPQVSYGAALHYFTGSKAHNIAVRKLAVAKGLKLNEYGVFRGDRRIAGRSEEEVFEQAGLPYIEPELREDHGEIEAAKRGKLPRLIAPEDIRGDLHTHTEASDGRNTIDEMAEAARQRGYAYLAISDHTKHVTIAHGLDEKRLGRQIEEIEALNERLRGLRILKAAEVDILEDGSLDLPNGILERLDLTVCAIHYKFDLPVERQTERIIRAMDHPCFNILAHPTGRLIGEREAYEVDMERVMEAALERGCYLEVNAQPERLDLTEIHCRMAKDLGLKVAISTDAHTTASLDYLRFGVGQARRGWLEPDDVLNTRSWTDLKTLLKRP
ncbi:MAG: DNA polymerase/3'-5' exonuclease PolX [Kiloniellales bacterium]|nr:DNA polymerase/3'-5' exonuclease PolX [Kiloniellales bacterium]